MNIVTIADIAAHRLVNQQIAGTGLEKPEQVVSWLCAMQAQDYAMAKWAIALRLGNTSDSVIDKAFDSGKILRTHILRPTWHFVRPADIHWMQMLTAHRVHAANASWYKNSGLTSSTVMKSIDTIAKALEGRQYKTRTALQAVLEKVKIRYTGIPLSYIMMYAELECIICSGPREGKQFTYALLDERAPMTRTYSRPDALKKLAERYFKSRGPATVQDFSWWSGLTIKEANEAVNNLGKKFATATVNGKAYIYPEVKHDPRAILKENKHRTTFLLPDYDEYGIAYKDREALFREQHTNAQMLFNHIVVIDGAAAGTWKKGTGKNGTTITSSPFSQWNKRQQQAVTKAVKEYERFTDKAPLLTGS